MIQNINTFPNMLKESLCIIRLLTFKIIFFSFITIIIYYIHIVYTVCVFYDNFDNFVLNYKLYKIHIV